MDLGTIYAINEENRVLELHLRNKKSFKRPRNDGRMVEFVIRRSGAYRLMVGE